MSRMAGIAQEELRRSNLSSMLRRVHFSGGTSRAALTAELGLNRSTIGGLVGELEALGLVRVEAPGKPLRSGRPSYVVAPAPDVGVLAVSLDVDRLSVALVGLGGVVLQRSDQRRDGAAQKALVAADAVATVCRELLDGWSGRLVGVGVSVPGVVRAGDGLVRFAPNLGWVDEPFTAALQQRLGLPVVAGNNADLGVVSEHLRGAAIGADDVAYLSGGVGVGGGFLVAGQLLRGRGGYAGEVGHLPVDIVNGIVCRCGARGCWETKVGANQLRAALGTPPTEAVSAAAGLISRDAAGNERSADRLRNAGLWIGTGLGAIVNLFDPAVIVLSGLLGEVWAAAPDVVVAAMDGCSVASGGDPQVRIALPGLGQDSSLLGAAELAFEPLLRDPAGALGTATGLDGRLARRAERQRTADPPVARPA